jgi:hypothetical protein
MKNKHGKHLLEDNFFEDGLLDKMDQPEGQQYIEMSDVLDAVGRCKAECSRTEDLNDIQISRSRTMPPAI